MTPEVLASLHASAFTVPRPWTAAEFSAILASPLHAVLVEPGGLAVIRTVSDEAELLSVAVAPQARRQGTGLRLVRRAAAEARARGARTMFLEVAADNPAALGLYARAGFRRSGLRRGYYRDGTRRVDAVLMRLELAAD